jgi:DNA polymerase-1
MGHIAFDLETEGLIERGQIPRIICYAYAKYDDDGSTHGGCFEWDKAKVEELLKDEIVIFHNSSFDNAVLRGHGVLVEDYEDTLLMSYVWEPSAEHSLKAWGELLDFPKLPNPWKGAYPTEFNEAVADRCYRDAELTLKLYTKLMSLLETDEQALRLYWNVELPYSIAVQEMERTGLYIDVETAQKISNVITQESDSLLSEIHHQFPCVAITRKKLKSYKNNWYKPGLVWSKYDDTTEEHIFNVVGPINPGSNMQVANALMSLGWEPEDMTKTGLPQVSEDVLSNIQGEPGEFAKKVLSFNGKIHLVNSFIKPMCEKFLASDGHVKGNFNQAVTLTGRLSSSKPNLQNIDTRIRELFTCPPGYLLVDGDLSNIEARMVAYYLWRYYDDESFATIFIEDRDFHDSNAESWNLERKAAKTVYFACIYGSGVGRISTTLGCSYREAQEILNKVYRACPNLRNLIQDVQESCKENDMILHSLLGRRLWYPAINSDCSELASRASRQVFNAVVQGSSADVLKVLTLESMPLLRQYDAVLAAAVHDQNVMYCPQETAQLLAADLTLNWSRSRMLSVPGKGFVPIKAEFKSGSRWSETH